MIEIADGTNKEQNERGYVENKRTGQKVRSERITKTQKERKIIRRKNCDNTEERRNA